MMLEGVCIIHSKCLRVAPKVPAGATSYPAGQIRNLALGEMNCGVPGTEAIVKSGC